MPRFGKEVDWEKEDQMFSRLCNMDMGVFYGDINSVPTEFVIFAREQAQRFSIPIFPLFDDFANRVFSICIYHVDKFDPYLCFHEVSDVQVNHDWEKYTYELLTPSGFLEGECEPELLETFCYIPGRAEAFFNKALSYPGLGAMPDFVTVAIREDVEENWQQEVMHGFGSSYTYEDSFSNKIDDCLTEACKKNGEFQQATYDAYFDFAIWAFLAWFLGPLGRQLRMDNSDVTEACLRFGECILFNGSVVPPTHYRKLSRPPQSCYICSVDAWCVEITLGGAGETRHICEGCLSEGIRPTDGATCGTKVCRYSDCHHHALHGTKDALINTMRKTGQLAVAAEERRQLGSGDPQGPKRLKA